MNTMQVSSLSSPVSSSPKAAEYSCSIRSIAASYTLVQSPPRRYSTMPTIENRVKRSNSIIIVGSLILLAIISFAVIHSLTREVVAVRVATVTHQDLFSTVSTNGKVEPVDEFQAHAPFSGVIEHIYVQVGQRVKAGQLLIGMADADATSRAAAAATNLHSAENVYNDITHNGTQEERINFNGDLVRAQLLQQQAQKELAALESLQQKGAASSSEVEGARQRLESANIGLKGLQQRAAGRFSQGDIARAKAALADAQANLAAARGNLNAIDIHAPFSGTVYSVPVSQYDFVPGGDDLMDVADLSKLQVRAYFDEPEIGRLAVGQPVKIIWDAKPNQTWHGHISRAPTTVITYNTRNVGECIITVDDVTSDLLPNTNVTVTVTTSQRMNVLSIPREALHSDGPNSFVYRVIDRNLVRTPVQVGVVNLNRVEITGGLNEKETVALTATSNRDLSDGMAIRPVE